MSITTGKVRASYVHIFQPQAPLNGVGDAKDSVTLLIPKSDVTTINMIYAEIEKAKQEGIQKVFNGTMPAMLAMPIYDGDGKRLNGEDFGEECRGHMVIRASSKDQPSIVDANIQPILNPSDVYSGCYIRASINFYAYNQAGNRGVGCGLNAVQKIADGEPLTARVTAQEAFGGSNTYQPVQAGYPVGGAYGSAPYAASAQPAYPQAQPMYPQMPQMQAPVQQPPYQQAPTMQPPYPAQQIDPVTGRPLMPGGVMGI